MKNGPYEMVVAPEEYPGKRYRSRYCYEHHLVWWQETKELVPDGFVVHHKNENKRDNRFQNLELKSREVHSSEHALPADTVLLECAYCGCEFEREARQVKPKLRAGQTRFFCCRSHQVSLQQQERWHIPR